MFEMASASIACVMAKPISGMKGDHADYAVKRRQLQV